MATHKTTDMTISSRAIKILADRELINQKSIFRNSKNKRRFRSTLGCSPSLCSWCWNQLQNDKLLPRGFQPKHFLWTLMFLKLYCCESVAAVLCGCDEKTFRKWVWIGIKALGNLDLVSVKNVPLEMSHNYDRV